MRGVVLLGLLLYAAAWFVPVHEFLDAADEVTDAVRDLSGLKPGEDAAPFPGPPGWQACRAAWELEASDSPSKEEGDALTILILRSTSVTNLAMVLAAIALAAGVRGRRAVLIGTLLCVCVVLNASWLYKTDARFREMLEPGYWMWLASFAIVGAGLLALGRSPQTSRGSA